MNTSLIGTILQRMGFRDGTEKVIESARATGVITMGEIRNALSPELQRDGERMERALKVLVQTCSNLKIRIRFDLSGEEGVRRASLINGHAVSIPKEKPDADFDAEKDEPTEAELATEAEEPVAEANGETKRWMGKLRHGSDDLAIKLYLQEIGQTKLLTAEEEVQLAARIKRGDKAAREQMIVANLRLVVKIACDYQGFGLPLLDLINEGNIGLMKAVERFDPSKGGKLSTYGSWWIKQAIKRALANQSKTIRLPVHLVDKISKMRRTSMRLQKEIGREPTDEELGEELGVTAARVASLRSAAIRPASLDGPIGDDGENRLEGVIKDENALSPYELLEKKTGEQMLREMFQKLDPREATILRYRFDLAGEGEMTLEEVGRRFGVTRERVRQVQNIALNKLRKMIEEREREQDTSLDSELA